MRLSYCKNINIDWIMAHVCRYWPFRMISDERYLKMFYKGYQHRNLNLSNPRTFNEKLQWLKLYDRRPEYTEMSDKYLVRDYVKKKIGEKYLVPLLGVWEHVDEIDYDALPEQFVLKCNHDSGSVCVCKDKETFDFKSAKKKLKKALHTQYYWKSREWNYRNIKRKIVAESYLENDESGDLADYKYFCFDGEPQFIQVDISRFTNHVRNFYDCNWKFIDVEYGCKNDELKVLPKPKEHEEMIKLAKILSVGYPHVRVDFYVCKKQVFFGELTFHHGGGVMPIYPFQYDEQWGKLLNLPKKYGE